MAVTVTLPVEAPTDLATTLVAGGTLDASTTYYWIMYAWDSTYMTPISTSYTPYHSPVTAEESFTTDAVNRSVKFNWTNSSGAVRYAILITKTSGDYSQSEVVGRTHLEYATAMPSDGTVGVTITEEPDTITAINHSYQLRNDLLGGLDKSLGILKVVVSGNDTIYPITIYNAVVAAGYGDYCYCSYPDTNQFYLKGWIVSEYGDNTSTGKLEFRGFDVAFIRGGVRANSPAFVIEFGALAANGLASENTACNIDIQNTRYSFTGIYENSLKMYGCNLTKNKRTSPTGEAQSTAYYYGGANGYIGYNMTNWKENLLGYYGRNNTSNLTGLKYGQGNNWSGYKHTDLDIIQSGNLNYGKCYFYNCRWHIKTRTQDEWKFYEWKSGTREDIASFYDNTFIDYPDGVIKAPYAFWQQLTADWLTSLYHMDIYYSFKATVLDSNGVPLEGVTVSAIDSSSNPANWIEKNFVNNDYEWTSGNEYTTDRTTDVNGQINYYLLAYDVRLNPENTTYPTSYDTVNNYFYPYTITFSKPGYGDYSIKINTLIKKTESTITLPIVTIPDSSPLPIVEIDNEPTTISIFEVASK